MATFDPDGKLQAVLDEQMRPVLRKTLERTLTRVGCNPSIMDQLDDKTVEKLLLAIYEDKICPTCGGSGMAS